METNSIHFRELKNYNDSNSCVILNLLMNNQNDVTILEKWLTDAGFSKGKSIIGYHHIEGNVLGYAGRSDYLIEFDHPEIDFNPFARLRMARDVKWTSDFIVNYGCDYGVTE